MSEIARPGNLVTARLAILGEPLGGAAILATHRSSSSAAVLAPETPSSCGALL